LATADAALMAIDADMNQHLGAALGLSDSLSPEIDPK
jgi:hypothetical protein